MQLDAKVRGYSLGDLLTDVSPGLTELGVEAIMQRTFLTIVREICEPLSSFDPGQITLLVHSRSPVPAWHCFALALRIYPDDP